MTAAALLLVCRCGGDAPANPIRVAVPAHDDSPPEAVITMRRADGRRLARASQPPDLGHPRPVALTEPRLRGIALGRDPNGGVARVRVSISQRIACRRPGGRLDRLLHTRYYPPPQIERIRSNPGAPRPAALTRSVPIELGVGRCAPGRPAAGLEAVTPHLRFSWRR